MLLRFSFLLGDMRCVSDGNFVKYEDFDRLQARLSEAEKVIQKYLEVNDHEEDCGVIEDGMDCSCQLEPLRNFLNPPKEKANGEA